MDDYWSMFESRISSEASEKLPCSRKLDANISSWSYDVEGRAKKCVEIYCEFANETTEQLFQVATPCLDDHHFKEEEMGSVGDLSKVCSQIVLKCRNLACIGRPDILWSVNKLVRAVTKWTRAAIHFRHRHRLAQNVRWILASRDLRQLDSAVANRFLNPRELRVDVPHLSDPDPACN